MRQLFHELEFLSNRAVLILFRMICVLSNIDNINLIFLMKEAFVRSSKGEFCVIVNKKTKFAMS